MAKKEPVGIVQVYGQGAWHQECCIIGEAKALLALRNALDVAIKKGDSEIEVWCSDGEGYDILIKRVSAGWENDVWIKLPLPYTEDYAKTHEDKITYSPSYLYSHKELIV